jgi:hypothetical protein
MENYFAPQQQAPIPTPKGPTDPFSIAGIKNYVAAAEPRNQKPCPRITDPRCSIFGY